MKPATVLQVLGLHPSSWNRSISCNNYPHLHSTPPGVVMWYHRGPSTREVSPWFPGRCNCGTSKLCIPIKYCLRWCCLPYCNAASQLELLLTQELNELGNTSYIANIRETEENVKMGSGTAYLTSPIYSKSFAGTEWSAKLCKPLCSATSHSYMFDCLGHVDLRNFGKIQTSMAILLLPHPLLLNTPSYPATLPVVFL